MACLYIIHEFVVPPDVLLTCQATSLIFFPCSVFCSHFLLNLNRTPCLREEPIRGTMVRY